MSDSKLDELVVAMCAADIPNAIRIETSMSLQGVIDIAMATRFACDDALMTDNIVEAKRFAAIHKAFDGMATKGLRAMAQTAVDRGFGPRDFDGGRNPFAEPGNAVVLDKQATHDLVKTVEEPVEEVEPAMKDWN